MQVVLVQEPAEIAAPVTRVTPFPRPLVTHTLKFALPPPGLVDPELPDDELLLPPEPPPPQAQSNVASITIRMPFVRITSYPRRLR